MSWLGLGRRCLHLASWLAFILLVIWLFIVALVVRAPAEWLLGQAQNQGFLEQVSWQDINGSLAAGEIRGLSWSGLQLDNLSWRLSVGRLLLANPSFNFSLGAQELTASSQVDSIQPWQLGVSFQPWGKVKVKLVGADLAGLTGNKSWLQAQGELPGVVEGTINLPALLGQQGGWCQELSGQLQGRVAFGSPMPLNLGQVTLQPSCTSAHLLNWRLTAEVAGEHSIRAEGTVNQQRWTFTATANLEEQAQLRPGLQLLGWQQRGQGNYQARGSGRF